MGIRQVIRVRDDVAVLLGEPVADTSDALVLRRRRKFRVAMVLAVGVSYAIDAAILTLLCVGGILGASIPWAYALAGFVHVGLFGALHWSGFSERFGDAQMTHWQMVYAIAVQLAFMWHAPVISSYFMSVIIIAFAFGSLRINLKQLMLFWLVTCLAVAFVLTDVRAGKVSIDHPSEFVVLLIWGGFATVLLRCILIGYFGAFLRVRLFEYSQGLLTEVESAEDQATHDKLTGALNRHALDAILEDQIQLRKRESIYSAVAMIDIDHFKPINDRFGHLIGDRTLRQVAQIVSEQVRTTDKVCRFGGDEFLVLLVDTSLTLAIATTERIREAVAGAVWDTIAAGLTVPVSAGITDIRASDTLPDLLLRVDAALYQAKEQGRNRTVSTGYAGDT